jgi:hypothetical protein
VADVGVGVRDLTIPGEFDEGVRMNGHVGLEFVDKVDERLEEDASSNAANSKKEDLVIVSRRGCV